MVPKQALTGWMSAIATYNPITYLLGGSALPHNQRLAGRDVLEGLAALAGIGLVSMALALAALRGRVLKGR